MNDQLLAEAEELPGAGHGHGPGAGSAGNVVVGTCHVHRGLEEPTGRPGQSHCAAVACELECGWRDRNYLAGGKNFWWIKAAGESKSDLRQLLR